MLWLLQILLRPCPILHAEKSYSREILQLLKNGRMSAGEIGSHFHMTGATVSYHLKILKKADLIWETKEKNFIYYDLNTSVVEELLLWLKDLKGDESHDEKI